MNLKPSMFFFISIISVACHHADFNTETPIAKTDTVNTGLSAANADTLNAEMDYQKADTKKDEILKFDRISKSIKGDFNGDGVTEKAWLASPNLKQLIAKYGNIPGIGDSYIRFTNPKIPSIKIESCIGGEPVNEGDLNGDGVDEIGLLPDWWTSNWYGYVVYTFRKGKWKLAVEPISIYWSDYYEKKVDVIRKDPQKSGYVIIKYSEIDNDVFVVKTKSERIK